MTQFITISNYEIHPEDALFFGGLLFGCVFYIAHKILDYILDNVLIPHRKILTPILGLIDLVFIFLAALAPIMMIIGLLICHQTLNLIMIFGPIILIGSLIRWFFK